MFEPERSFTLTEDASRLNNINSSGNQQIEIPNKMQIFATIHSERPADKVRVSAATRSRFTEIQVSAYALKEIHSVMQCALRQHALVSTSDITAVADYLLALQDIILQDGITTSPTAVSLSQLLRVCDCVVGAIDAATGTATVETAHIQWLTFVGARYLILDSMPTTMAAAVSEQWQRTTLSELDTERIHELYSKPSATNLQSPLTYVNMHTVKCSFVDVFFKRVHDMTDDQQVTATTLSNIVRIMVGTLANAPVLLEGPPGSGIYSYRKDHYIFACLIA
jgi:midasin (ATPase involved in ribosome maturation)